MEPIHRVTTSTIKVLKCIYGASESGIWGLEISKTTGLKAGTVYPILERLESLGWLHSEWQYTSDRNGPRRRIYRISLEAFHEIRNLSGMVTSVELEATAWKGLLGQAWAR